MRFLHRTAPAILVAALLVSCGEDGPPEPTGPDDREIWPPSTAEVPDGFHEELCPDLRDDGRSLSLRLVVPDEFEEAGHDDGGCYFAADLDRSFSVSLGVEQSLETYKETAVDPDDGGEGDDGVSEIEYDADAAVFGDRRGELLTYDANNDGLPLDNRLVQADGVRLSWDTTRDEFEQTADQYDAVADSLAVIRSDEATCHHDGLTAYYRPPVPLTDSIERYGEECHVYLRPRESLLHYAEVLPLPRRSVAELAEQLEGERHVTSVDYEPGAASLAGQQADRLTWIEETHGFAEQPGRSYRQVLVGLDDLHVTWGAKPEQWRSERDDYELFLDSVRLDGS